MTLKTQIAVAAVAGLVVLGSGRAARAEEGSGARALEGTWLVQVTLEDCATHAPRPPFYSLLTFGHGGTLVETTNNPAFQPGQRSPGHGVWSHTGRRTFSATSDAFIMFTSAPNPPAPGFTRGLQRIAQTITIRKADPNAFDSVATVQFFDGAGNPLVVGCATAVGQRF